MSEINIFGCTRAEYIFTTVLASLAHLAINNNFYLAHKTLFCKIRPLKLYRGEKKTFFRHYHLIKTF
jgi:hypothetical protein